MRISDWSSDVCSSDLIEPPDQPHQQRIVGHLPCAPHPRAGGRVEAEAPGVDAVGDHHQPVGGIDRKSVVKGQSVSVSVDLGGRRILQKKTTITTRTKSVKYANLSTFNLKVQAH